MKQKFLSVIFLFLLSAGALAQQAEKIDEFSTIPCEEYLMRVDMALIRAQEAPSATVYVFIYEGRENRYNAHKKKTEPVFPVRGSVKAKIASMKEYLSIRKFPVERFNFIEAGFRQNSTVEFWLVPPGADLPKPNPTLKTMKYRKGKSRGFCIDCCSL